MTKQHQNPEKPRKIEITEADVAPIEVEVSAADIVDRSEPIVLDESDFPTEVTPEKIVLGRSDFGEGKEKTVISESDLSVPSEGKIGHEEMKAAKVFTAFVQEHLPDEFDEYSAGGKDIKDRESEYSVEAEGQLIPVSKVRFSEYREGPLEELEEVPSNYVGIEVFGLEDEPKRDIKYDKQLGFVETTEMGHSEITPDAALEAVAILTAASDRGDLKPLEPASRS